MIHLTRFLLGARELWEDVPILGSNGMFGKWIAEQTDNGSFTEETS